MVLINYPNIIRVGERSLIIIIGLVYISPLRGEKYEISQNIFPKRERIERKENKKIF